MVKSEQMSPVDTTWLRMDRPANPMVIVGVLMLEGPVDVDRLERTIADRLFAMPRFRQRVEQRATGYWWSPDPHFSINRHIKRLRLPGRALDRLTHSRLIGMALSTMRKPARLAGFEDLQNFLERGHSAFRKMRGADEFLQTIVTRERRLLEALFAGDDSLL